MLNQSEDFLLPAIAVHTVLAILFIGVWFKHPKHIERRAEIQLWILKSYRNQCIFVLTLKCLLVIRDNVQLGYDTK